MQARNYQIVSRDSISPSSINLLTLPMRAGKSFISKLIIDEHSTTKALVIVGYRKIVLQFEQYFPSTSTFILSGKPFNHTKQVHLATFQTYQNRDLDIAEYDLVIVDEYHSRQSASVNSLINQAKSNGATVVLLTGTPLTNKNKLITEHVDTFIQPITVLQMKEQGYLAPTKFFSVKDVISGNKQTLKTNRNDYTEAAVTEVISKSNLLESIVNQVTKQQLDTEHNTLIYVNFISTATKLFGMLSDYNNVNIVHSKMSNKEQELALNKYNSGPGICISVRSLSLGFDSPKSDRLIFGILTQIHSLALQVMWRASTLDPSKPAKVTEVYDMTGQLNQVNPYTDFSEYGPHKPSCMDEAKLIADEEERYYAMLACEAAPIVSVCNGNLPSSYVDNPFVIDFVVKGTPCNEVLSIHDFKYITTESKSTKGIIYKWTKCQCGCVTKVVLKTMTVPADLVLVYDDSPSKPTNKVLAVYNKELNKVLLIIDDPKLVTYKFKFAANQEQIFSICKQVLNGKPFQLASNIKLPKLPNSNVNKSLANLVNLANWDDESKNTGLIRKLCKSSITKLTKQFGYSKGWTYYFMKAVTNSNMKELVSLLESNPSKSQLNRFKLKYEEQLGLSKPSKSNQPILPRPSDVPDIDFDIDDGIIPF